MCREILTLLPPQLVSNRFRWICSTCGSRWIEKLLVARVLHPQLEHLYLLAPSRTSALVKDLNASWSVAAFFISRREIMTYADTYDPQPIHIDENYARMGPFGGVIASGFQTISLAFRLFVETGYFEDGVSMGGPGMDEVRWLLPVYPEDVLTNHIRVLETRPSKSKPDRGILRLGHELRNHKGQTCTTGSTVTIVKLRPAG